MSEPVGGVVVTFSGPGSGAGATFPGGTTATLDANGQGSVAAAANGTAGSYAVTADASGAAPVNATLTNRLPIVPGSVSADVQLGVVPTVPALQAAFVASLAPQNAQVIGPIVVFNDPVFFGRKAFQLRDRHGHSVRLHLQGFYLATGQTVVVLGWGRGQLNWRDLVEGKYVLTIDGRRVFDGFGRGPLGGMQKVRFFPLVGDLDPSSSLAGALTAVGERSPS
jgi:hypothetical protein